MHTTHRPNIPGAKRNANGTIPPLLVSAVARTLIIDTTPKATIAAVRKARALLDGVLA